MRSFLLKKRLKPLHVRDTNPGLEIRGIDTHEHINWQEKKAEHNDIQKTPYRPYHKSRYIDT